MFQNDIEDEHSNQINSNTNIKLIHLQLTTQLDVEKYQFLNLGVWVPKVKLYRNLLSQCKTELA